jgi:hypothetical protein
MRQWNQTHVKALDCIAATGEAPASKYDFLRGHKETPPLSLGAMRSLTRNARDAGAGAAAGGEPAAAGGSAGAFDMTPPFAGHLGATAGLKPLSMIVGL